MLDDICAVPNTLILFSFPILPMHFYALDICADYNSLIFTLVPSAIYQAPTSFLYWIYTLSPTTWSFILYVLSTPQKIMHWVHGLPPVHGFILNPRLIQYPFSVELFDYGALQAVLGEVLASQRFLTSLHLIVDASHSRWPADDVTTDATLQAATDVKADQMRTTQIMARNKPRLHKYPSMPSDVPP